MSALLERILCPTAQKPSGWFGKFAFNYSNWSNYSFPRILGKLNLRSDDTYLEVGCGAGQLLQQALKTVGRAAAIDHSSDMVEVSRKRNREAVEKGIAEIVEGKAEALPWPDEQFSCAACANAFFFMDSSRVLSEVYRVLKPGGRLVIYTYSKKPSLMGSIYKLFYKVTVYTDDELSSLLRQASFSTVEVQSKREWQLGYIHTQLCYAQKQ